MKPHIPDDPTEVDVQTLLGKLMVIFTGVGGGGVPRLRVVWSADLPAILLAEAETRNASFIVETKTNEYILGYKGSNFTEAGPIFIPPPADRGERYVFPMP